MSEESSFGINLEHGTKNELAYATTFEYHGEIVYRVVADNCYDRDWGTGIFYKDKWMPAPDLFVAKHNYYIEAKWRLGWTHYNNDKLWQVGINEYEIEKCRMFNEWSGLDVKLWFTIATPKAKDSLSAKTPNSIGTGVFQLDYNSVKRHHRHPDKNDKGYAYYYNATDLIKIMDIKDLMYANEGIRKRNYKRYGV